MRETQFATTLIVCWKAGVALLVSAGTGAPEMGHRPSSGGVSGPFGPFPASPAAVIPMLTGIFEPTASLSNCWQTGNHSRIALTFFVSPRCARLVCARLLRDK